MDFAGSGLAHHANYLAAGGASNNGVVHQHDTLALQEIADGVEFELDTKITDRLRGLDKRTAHIMIADQSLPERETGFGRISDGGSDARVRNGNDEIGVGGRFAGEQASEI